MKLRRNRKKTPVEVMLSPLIDCVFLLLIFFLVTSMFKRFERQIPVNLADDTSAITADPNDDAYMLGVDKVGGIYAPSGKNWSGVATFAKLAQPDAFLCELVASRGADAPVTVVVEKGTPFQQVINFQDQLELIGFENARFRIRDFDLAESGSATRRDKK